MLIVEDSSFEGLTKFQTARQWIPQAGIARRLDISPRAIRRLDDYGDLTVRLIPGCQAGFWPLKLRFLNSAPKGQRHASPGHRPGDWIGR